MADPNQAGYNLPPGYTSPSQQGYGGPPGAPQHPGAPPPQAYPPQNYQPMTYFYYISSKLNGLVLDLEGGNESPLTRVVLWHKKDVLDADNQLWYNDYSTGTIKSKLNNLCLEFKDGKVLVNTYQPGNPNQLWEGTAQAIRNRMNQNLVFEVQGGNRDPGAAVVASEHTGSPQQQFEPIFPPPPPGATGSPGQMPPGQMPPGQMPPGQMPPGQMPPGQMIPGQMPPGQMPQGYGYPPPSGGQSAGQGYPQTSPTNPVPSKPAFVKKMFYLVSEMHGKVMDIEGGNEREGTPVIVYHKQKDSKNQLWYLDEEGLLKSALNDFVLCGSGKASPIKMVLFTGGASQRFRLDGKKIVNGVGECADIRGAWKNDGAPVITYPYSGKSNQHWRAEYI